MKVLGREGVKGKGNTFSKAFPFPLKSFPLKIIHSKNYFLKKSFKSEDTAIP